MIMCWLLGLRLSSESKLPPKSTPPPIALPPGSEHLQGRNGGFSAPNYPQPYQSNNDLVWIIEVPSGYIIYIQVFDVSIKYVRVCVCVCVCVVYVYCVCVCVVHVYCVCLLCLVWASCVCRMLVHMYTWLWTWISLSCEHVSEVIIFSTDHLAVIII